ncbi:hypothetical protein KX816_08480 [Sphingosinicellaceae bacterium]|nr:hypothetical protein KX816_08480 [Sphingosinicellaceae bacterium]
MRFLTLFPVLVALPLLAACHAKSDSKDADNSVTVDKTVTFNTKGTKASASAGDNGFKIDTDDFKASLEIPGLQMGGKSFDVDGMNLLPGSQVRGMSVVSHEKDGDKNDKVTISFTSPGTPDAVLVHAEAEAKAKGWSVARTATGLGGTKGEKTIAYAVVASGAKTNGTVTLTGDD